MAFPKRPPSVLPTATPSHPMAAQIEPVLIRRKDEAFDTDPTKPLRKPAHETFAQLRAAGKTLRQAYVGAGYSGTQSSAGYRLAREPAIDARIRHLMEEARIRRDAKLEASKEELETDFKLSNIDLAWLVKETVVNLTMSREMGDMKTANACIQQIAEMTGHSVKKGNNPTPGDLNEPKSSYPINVQVLNQISGGVDRGVGNVLPEGQTIAHEGATDPVPALRDDRRLSAVDGVTGFAGEDDEEIPILVEVPRD